MSESIVYLKALYRNKTEAKSALAKTKKFLLQLTKAYLYQQRNAPKTQRRGRFGDLLPYRRSDSLPLKEFKKLFPDVWKAIQLAYPNTVFKYLDDLSRKLSFGPNKDEIVSCLFLDDTIISYVAEIGGMTQWGSLPAYLKSLGAIKVVWGNQDDGIGSLDSLQLYPWKEIVQSILDKAALPTLIGIHPDLDILLESRLR
jgi:hypothetical protein